MFEYFVNQVIGYNFSSNLQALTLIQHRVYHLMLIDLGCDSKQGENEIVRKLLA